MSEVRNNPPSSVRSFEENEMYKVLHDDMVRDGKILQYQDRHGLGELAITLVEMSQLREHISEHGVMMTVSGDKGNTIVKRNGSCDVLDRKINSYHKLMKAFGMAPEYRPRLDTIVEVQSTDDGFGEI